MLALSRMCVAVGTAMILAGGTMRVYSNTLTGSQKHATSTATAQPTDARECGAVCLFTITRLSGNADVTLDYLRNLTAAGPYGTTMHALKVAAEHIGFQRVQGLELSGQALARRVEAGEFAILHLGRRHFVCVVGMTESGRIVLFDGMLGVTAYEAKCLAATIGWSGKALLLKPEAPQNPIRFRER